MKYILLLALCLPFISNCQVSHYDSLLAKGVISKTEYLLLVQSYKTNNPAPQPYDTLQALLNRYDSLYTYKQITKQEYFDLVEKAKTTMLHTVVTPVFDPKQAREKARRQTSAGVVVMLLSDVFSGIALGRGVSDGSRATDSGNITLISFGVAFRIVGIGLFGHTATLRRRAERYELTH